MNNIDLTNLEEQILDYLKDSETNLLKLIDTKNLDLKQNVNKLEAKVNELSKDQEEIKEALTFFKIYKEKLANFDIFRHKTDDILISHELRIKDSIKDIFFLKDKYDKILNENLLVPGYIGVSCKFKNLSDFLAYNIVELNTMKTEKDDRKKEIKELKTKNENLMKSMISLNDGSIERCKDYTKNIQKDIIKYIDNKMEEYEKKNFAIKTEIYKYYSLNVQKNNDFNNKLAEIKKELLNILDEKITQIKDIHNSLSTKIDENYEKIRKNLQEIKKINNNIEEIHLKLKDNYLNIKNLNLSLNNISQSLISLENKNTEIINSPKISLQKNTIKTEVNITTNPSINTNSNTNKVSTNEISKSNRQLIEKISTNDSKENNSNRNQSKVVNLKSNISFLKSIKDKENVNLRKSQINNDYENDFDNENENENFINSDIDNFKNKSKYIHTSNSSFEKVLLNKISFQKKNKNSSNNDINIFKNEKNINQNKINNISTDLNRYFKREEITAKSLSPLKKETLQKDKEITFYKYKSKENSNKYIKSEKILHPAIKQNTKSQTQKEVDNNYIIKEKENLQEREKSNNFQNEKKSKLKLNYDLINNLHQKKVLDLYSFSTSPPNGKINLNYWTIDSLTAKFFKKQKQKEIEKEARINCKLAQIGNKNNNIIKQIKSQSNIQNERIKFQKMKKGDNHLSSEKIKNKKEENNRGIVYKAIIDIPPKFNFPFNKTFFENDYNKLNNNEGIRLRNTMKELKLNDNIHCLTYK